MRMLVNINFPHTWQHTRTVRKCVGDALANDNPDRRSAAMMTASELVENAIKYGEEVPQALGISFAMLQGAEGMRIEVSNGSTDVEAVGRLERRVAEIAGAPDKAALYMARLEELLAQPTESGRLGLYRIAFEGQFDLQCHYANSVVTMLATRSGS
jgi:hypothetical protein